ncbi:MAG: hypothetical protein M1831_004811 [Alyxoria varia]|nr:MAG: hypothetical protein M1831_004811 [Alyxoria varia]
MSRKRSLRTEKILYRPTDRTDAQAVSPETRASYTSIIDGILTVSDLEKISAKQIRNGLQSAVGHDITPYKDAIKELIMERFDEAHNRTLANDSTTAPQEPPAAPTTNGVSASTPPPKVEPPVYKSTPSKRQSPSSDASDSATSPPPKKKPKKAGTAATADEKLAARLQAEENTGRRATRGGGPGTRKKAVQTKGRGGNKKKSANKVKADDDSEVESDGGGAEEAKEKKRNGAFHKELMLSAPLAELVGETLVLSLYFLILGAIKQAIIDICFSLEKLSRPQTVKRIWAYVKERDLQNPEDKRQIRCDDAMRAVFKQDTVHMFTMNKILAQHLYEPEE